MEGKPAPPEITLRIKQVGRSTGKLLMIEYFMRQYPTLSEGLSKIVEQYEAEHELRQSSKRSEQ